MDKVAEDLFEKFALKQRRDLKDLAAVRRAVVVQEGSTVTVTCSSVAHVLNHNYRLGYWRRTGVLMYGHEESNLHCWLIGDKGLLAYQSKRISIKKLNHYIEEQRLALGVERLQSSRTSSYRKFLPLDVVKAKKSLDEATIELSELLIPSTIASALSEVIHLIIVPIHSLGTVPFSMLRPFTNKEAVLIEQVSLSIAPSLFDLNQVLAKTFDRPDLEYRFEAPLVVGISEFPQHLTQRLSPLPGVRKEIETVAQELEVQPLLNSQATKKTIYASGLFRI